MMPDSVFGFLVHYANDLWAAAIGLVGASVRVAWGISNNERMPRSLMFATLTSGAVLAMTSGTVFTDLMGLSTQATNFCSFIVGIIGMKVVKQAVDAELPQMFLAKKPRRKRFK